MYETQFEIDGKWTTVANCNTLLQQLSNDTNSTIIKVGESELGEDIIGLKIGDGINKTLVTSGVHGVEPASREAVLIKLRDICCHCACLSLYVASDDHDRSHFGDSP